MTLKRLTMLVGESKQIRVTHMVAALAGSADFLRTWSTKSLMAPTLTTYQHTTMAGKMDYNVHYATYASPGGPKCDYNHGRSVSMVLRMMSCFCGCRSRVEGGLTEGQNERDRRADWPR